MTPARESQNPAKTGIPNRRKSCPQTPLSGKIDYFKPAASTSQSMPWAFFTDDYLRTQFEAFASGERHNDIGEQMRNVARRMTTAEIGAASEYYAER
jgi:hypothetical protein